MAFCNLSSDFMSDGYTYIENSFLLKYLPKADGEYVKVYLYGFYLSTTSSKENTIDDICEALDKTPDQLYNIYKYWHDEGLVQIIQTVPFSVKYLSIKNKLPKIYKEEKFEDFNSSLQAYFPNRIITPNEYNAYYETMDNYRITPQAMIMIVSYCISLKNENINYSYILKVARDWASSGVRTVKGVENKIMEYNTYTPSIKLVAEALEFKGIIGLYENQLFEKWYKNWGYSIDSIVYCAKNPKIHTFGPLDNQLENFYKLNLFTIKEIEEYTTKRKQLKDIAIAINKKLGVYYEDLDNEIETYLVPWLNMGFNKEALETIANYCFLCNIRELRQMDSIIHNFYKEGCLSTKSINDYIEEQVYYDSIIQQILDKIGAVRSVSFTDRKNYRTWKNVWNISDDLIDYAITLAKDKNSAMAYLNQVLANWHRENIKTVEDAKKTTTYTNSTTKQNNKQVMERNYTPQELNAIFNDIDDDNFDF